jgi:hypothetical protein
MRKATIILVVVALLAAGLIVFVSRPAALDRLGLGGDSGKLRLITQSFLEDIQFKDFAKAASYHSPDDQKTVDIPFLLERLFGIKPEQLDIMSYEIVFADIDSSGLRGRVKSRVKVKILVNGAIEDRELMLYFSRDTPQSPWFMRLESSLRALEAEQGKKS